jgi:hypothetical protein
LSQPLYLKNVVLVQSSKAAKQQINTKAADFTP